MCGEVSLLKLHAEAVEFGRVACERETILDHAWCARRPIEELMSNAGMFWGAVLLRLRPRAVCLRPLALFLLIAAGFGYAAVEVVAEEKTFLMTPQVCQLLGGRASISNEKEDYYTEIVGSLSGQPSQMCVAGWFGARTCVNVTLHNFKVGRDVGLGA
jgi:hypothetical protein